MVRLDKTPNKEEKPEQERKYKLLVHGIPYFYANVPNYILNQNRRKPK